MVFYTSSVKTAHGEKAGRRAHCKFNFDGNFKPFFFRKKKKIDHQGRRRYIRDASFYFTYLLKKKI